MTEVPSHGSCPNVGERDAKHIIVDASTDETETGAKSVLKSEAAGVNAAMNMDWVQAPNEVTKRDGACWATFLTGFAVCNKGTQVTVQCQVLGHKESVTIGCGCVTKLKGHLRGRMEPSVAASCATQMESWSHAMQESFKKAIPDYEGCVLGEEVQNKCKAQTEASTGEFRYHVPHIPYSIHTSMPVNHWCTSVYSIPSLCRLACPHLGLAT